MFTRKKTVTTRTTRSTVAVEVAPAPAREPSPPPPPPPPVKRQTKVAKPRATTSRTAAVKKPVKEPTPPPPPPPSSPPVVQTIPERKTARTTKTSSRQQPEPHTHHHHHHTHEPPTPKRHPDPVVEKTMTDAGLRPVTPPPHQPQPHRKELGVERVLIPASDTPIIQRNKQFRNDGGAGQRRSSLGLRGRRASSLMDNGQVGTSHANVVVSFQHWDRNEYEVFDDGDDYEENKENHHPMGMGWGSQEEEGKDVPRSTHGNSSEEVTLIGEEQQLRQSGSPEDDYDLPPPYYPVSSKVTVTKGNKTDMRGKHTAEPHADLDPDSYWKHIDADMVEPRRMKQLLVWCAKRASNEQEKDIKNKKGVHNNAVAIGMVSITLCFCL